MSKFKVMVTDCPWGNLELERSVLAPVGAEVFVAPDGRELTLLESGAPCHAFLNCWAQVTAQVIQAAPDLRVVARMGVGLDSIDVACCTSRGILVTNVPDYCYREVAEHALALMLCLARKLHLYRDATRAGRYNLAEYAPFNRLEGQTLGIVGLGRIGTALATRAQGLGLRILATTRSPVDLDFVTRVPLAELLACSDYVSLCCPLTPETRRLLGEREFQQLKPGAYLINTARGGLVDHAALYAALQRGQLAGAALDVQDPEPPDLALPPWNDPRVLVTPHTAFISVESLRELRLRAASQVAAVLTGKVPENVRNPQVLAQ